LICAIFYIFKSGKRDAATRRAIWQVLLKPRPWQEICRCRRGCGCGSGRAMGKGRCLVSRRQRKKW